VGWLGKWQVQPVLHHFFRQSLDMASVFCPPHEAFYCKPQNPVESAKPKPQSRADDQQSQSVECQRGGFGIHTHSQRDKLCAVCPTWREITWQQGADTAATGAT
jgi:hypothetical protein